MEIQLSEGVHVRGWYRNSIWLQKPLGSMKTLWRELIVPKRTQQFTNLKNRGKRELDELYNVGMPNSCQNLYILTNISAFSGAVQKRMSHDVIVTMPSHPSILTKFCQKG